MALSPSELFPIIEFTKDAMKPGTATWDLTRKHVLKALEEHGFFQATFNEITQELYTALFSSSEKFFDLPKDTKLRCRVSEDIFDGYLSDFPLIPLYEGVGVLDPLNYESIQKLTHRVWPQGDPTFSKTWHSYATLVMRLENTVRNMIFQTYGLEENFEGSSMKYSMSLMKYKAPMTIEVTPVTPTHFDKNFMTIIQDKGLGLEVQTKDGHWINPKPSGSSLVVLLGESIHGWSNGRLKCPRHHVRMKGSEPRYSVALYVFKKGKIEIPSELVDEEHPLLFKSFDQAGLLETFMRKYSHDAYKADSDNIVPVVRAHFTI